MLWCRSCLISTAPETMHKSAFLHCPGQNSPLNQGRPPPLLQAVKTALFPVAFIFQVDSMGKAL